MKLRDLIDQNWKSHEKKRFLKDETKVKTDSFDPESFKHDGFKDRDKYLEEYVPALADETRLENEFNNFTPPRLNSINGSPYQALVIRYGILRTLIQEFEYQMESSALLEAVQSWQQRLIEEFAEEAFPDDDKLLHLARAAVDYGSDIDDSELHMIYSYMELHNQAQEWKHEYYTWLDFFKRLSSIDRFPKVSRSEKPAHAIDTIGKGLWSLQEQAIVYEIVHPERGDIAGIPEDYADYIRDWLYYEMSTDNYRSMLEELEPFQSQSTLIAARKTFGIDTPTKGRNAKRRESIVSAGVYPSELLEEVVEKQELKEIVDTYGLDAHKQKTDEMIEKIVEYFEQSQKYAESDENEAELYLKCYEDIADGNVSHVPPQLQGMVDEADLNTKLDILFERATAEIFTEIFNLEGTELLGQTAGGNVADGEIKQDGQWLLWDNKRRAGKFKLGSNTRAKIKDYIETKNQQHEVEWFLIIAPEFSSQVANNAIQLEMQLGVDIRLIRAADFTHLATIWQEGFAQGDRELPLSIFYGTGELNLEAVAETLETQFA